MASQRLDLAVRTLRRRWKPHKLRLSGGSQEQQNTAIRFHRACSWLGHVQSKEDAEKDDLSLVSLWIAFNALYGCWDESRREPRPDRESWRRFVDAILELDETGYLNSMLIEHKRLVLSLLDDEFLSGFFWQDPSETQASRARRAKHRAQTWYFEKRWTTILDELLERIYLMRCQLVHGAATYRGKLNRTSLRRCIMMMQRLVPTFLMVWIDHGAEITTGDPCAIRRLADSYAVRWTIGRS